MGGTSRTETVAMLGERRIPTLLQDLQQRLLDQSVVDTRDAEFPDPAIRFGYLNTLDRLRLVGPRHRPRRTPAGATLALMELDFAIRCPLVQPRMPRIRFLFVRSRLCSTLPSDATSR